MIGRIAQAKQTLATYDADNPHTAGRLRQALGGVLIADGLVGLENPLNGQKARPGLIGSMAGIVFAAIFVAIPFFMLRTVNEQEAVQTDPPMADDPFFNGTDPGFTGSDMGGPPEFFNWVIYGFIALGALLLLSAICTTLVRVASIVFGIVLLRSGTKMVAANPATSEDPGVVAEAQAHLTRLLTTTGGGLIGGFAGSRMSSGVTESGMGIHDPHNVHNPHSVHNPHNPHNPHGFD